MWQKLKEGATRAKAEAEVWRRVLADPRTPRRARWLLALALGYMAFPIDLVPDFIPVLGYLDDVLIVGLCVWLARRSIPEEVMVEARGG